MSTQSILLKVLRQVTKLPDKLVELAALLTCLDFRLQEHREIITRKLGIKERSVWKHYSKLKDQEATHIVDRRVLGFVHVLMEYNENEFGKTIDILRHINVFVNQLGPVHVFKLMRVKGGSCKKHIIILLTTSEIAHRIVKEHSNAKVCITVPVYTCPWLELTDVQEEDTFFKHVIKREPLNLSPIMYEAVRMLDAKPYAYLTEVIHHVEKETRVSASLVKKLYREASLDFWLGRVMPRWLTPHTPLLVSSHEPIKLHKLISKNLLATGLLVCDDIGTAIIPGTYELMKQPEWRKIDEVFVIEYVRLKYLPPWRKLFGPDFKWKRYPRSLKSL